MYRSHPQSEWNETKEFELLIISPSNSEICGPRAILWETLAETTRFHIQNMAKMSGVCVLDNLQLGLSRTLVSELEEKYLDGFMNRLLTIVAIRVQFKREEMTYSFDTFKS